MWGVVAKGEEHLPKTADFGPGMDCSFTESECESEFEGLVYAYDSRQKECKLKYLLLLYFYYLFKYPRLCNHTPLLVSRPSFTLGSPTSLSSACAQV